MTGQKYELPSRAEDPGPGERLSTRQHAAGVQGLGKEIGAGPDAPRLDGKVPPVPVRGPLVELAQARLPVVLSQRAHERAGGATARTMSLLVASTVLAAISTGPAQAATSAGGCTVTPLAPAEYASSVRYSAKLDCLPYRQVTLEAQAYEQDPGPHNDDYLGGGSLSWSTSQLSASKTVSDWLPKPDTESGDEEVYLRVRFQVKAGSTVSSWTPWELSSVVVIPDDWWITLSAD